MHKTAILLTLASVLLYFVFAYHITRTDYARLVLIYAVLFVIFYKLVHLLKDNTKALTYFAFGFRAIFILATPNLSQDFYRFIWDGRMILEGQNPYLYTVASFITKGELPVAQAQELYNGMGILNAGHFSNYPPINQLCFTIAALCSGKSILGSTIVMRLLIIAADFGTLRFGKKLLERLKLPSHHIFWYVLNPFIIIELTGNLHFEGVMIFFLVWSLYLLHSGKWQWAAVILALSISVKLIPLLFLPLFFQWFTKQPLDCARGNKSNNWSTSSQASDDNKINKKWFSTTLSLTRLILFYTIIGITTLLLFLPFYASGFIKNYGKTVALWFTNFEFNASLYYIARAIGYTFRGYNEIAIIGQFIPLMVLFFVLAITFFRRNKSVIQLVTAMLLALSFYYFTATTVHPWYIATLLILSVFTRYKFPLVWSLVIVLSYLAYLNINKADKQENLYVIALEYLIVYGVFIWEVFFTKSSKNRNLIFLSNQINQFRNK